METRIAEFLVGELADRTGVEEHLLACPACRAQFSLARSGWEAAREWKAPAPSGDAIASTLEALESAPPSRALLRFLQAGTIAASLVIVAALGTSRKWEPAPEPPARAQVAAPARPASTGLASLRPSVGQLYLQDDQGRPAGELEIASLTVRVDLRDGVARTEIEEIFRNRSERRLEGTFLFPLPPDASISRLAMEIDGKLMEGEVVERQKARQTYEGIVRSMKDPALLEWMPGGLFQCRVFPIEARGDKRIVIAYTQALSVFDGRARYVYPLAGESARELGIGRFEISAMIRSGSRIAKAGSTSHDAPTIRLDDRTMRTTFARSDFRPSADFVLAFETEPPPEIQVAAHRPEGSEPGYFAAFVTPRPDAEEDRRRPRQVFFLLDATGSLARAEMEAARSVVRRMVESLGPADRFRIGCHNILVGAMDEFIPPDEAGRRAAERYLADVVPTGAGDLASALETALGLIPDDGELVYVGEGTPTWGEKDPAKIVERVRAAIGERRLSIRTVAVGSDAERGLLETLAREFNGGAHAISPSDDVAARAAEIARTLGRPVVTDLKVEFVGPVTDAAPAALGSLHFGERLLVTGRFGPGPVTLVLTGRLHDRKIRREFALALPEREPGNLHVKRLWAQRRLADLAALGEAKRAETVKLSVECQVMTPYTSFLVLENEKAYEQHRIDRTKKESDQAIDPSGKKDREAVAKLLDRRKELELLLSQAKIQFEREQFQKCIEVCDRILYIDPRLNAVDEMKQIAQRLDHVKQDRDLTRSYIEQWKRIFERVERVGIIQTDELSFPAREEWFKMIRRRQPKGILGVDDTEDYIQDYDIQVALAPVAPDPIPSLWGINISAAIPGQVYPALSALIDPDGAGGPLADQRTMGKIISDDDMVDLINRPPVGGYDIGGVGFSEIDERLLPHWRNLPKLSDLGRSESERQRNLRQLHARLQEKEDTIRRLGEQRQRLDGAHSKSMTATQDLQYQRQERERLLRDIAAMEEDVQRHARERQRLQEAIANLSATGSRCDQIAPGKPLSGKVTAVANELDLVVISIGRDAGVNEGDEFSLSRGSSFTGRIVIDRVDRAWASGRIVVKGKETPAIGDNASPNLFGGPLHPAARASIKIVCASDLEVQFSDAKAEELAPKDLVVLWRNGAYVAVAEIREVVGVIAKARIVPRLRAMSIQPGDVGIKVRTPAELWGCLPSSLRQDVASRRDQADARLKLLLLRARKGGTP